MMDERLLTSDHIKKLGHPILEIRQRALSNIICKLSNGCIFDNEVARIRELITKLFGWFLLEPCTDQVNVLELLYQILQSKTGQLILQHCGKSTIKLKLEELRSFIEPNHLTALDTLIKLVDACEKSKVEVPPLYSDVPLSYRSDSSENPPFLGSTATTMRGYLEKDASLDYQIGNFKDASSRQSQESTTLGTTSSEASHKENFLSCDSLKSDYLKLTLPWQALIETDRNVLTSVEESLVRPLQPGALFHTCEFFTNVLLHDFPAEVFLQRPNIVLVLINLLQSSSSKRLISVILECLLDLTKALKVRVNHCNDPNIQHLKTLVDSPSVSPFSSRQESRAGSPFSIETEEDVRVLKESELSLTDFSLQTMRVLLKCLIRKEEYQSDFKPKFNTKGTNTSLLLLDELSNLLFMVVTTRIWRHPNNTEILRLLKEINDIFTCYGDALEYFRVESMSLENESTVRVVYLCLLHLAANLLQGLIPPSKSRLILPKNFKMSIANSLLDVSLSSLYPKMSEGLTEYVENFSEAHDLDSLHRCKQVTNISNSLRVAVRFLRENDTLGFRQCLSMAEAALPSLEFHRNLKFVQDFVDMCSKKMYAFRENTAVKEKVEAVLVKLLAHHMNLVQEETYKLSHRQVLDNIGVKAQACGDGNSGSRIFFLLSSKIFREMILFGLKNIKVNSYAEDILLCVLKCKPLVSQDIWNYCVETLISVMTHLFCFADNTTNLGRNIISLADPDTAHALTFPNVVMFRANVQLFFSKDPYIRDEAFSRICWLMAGQDNSKDLLPKMMTVFDKALANSCEIKRVVDLNKIRHHDHFYQPSSLIQVMDLLKSTNVEPVIRRSALNQISVIMEDSLLHDVFFEQDGIDLMVEVMKSALTEKDYKDYPDAIVPVVSILKNVALYNPFVKEELGRNEDVLYLTLRGLFLFFTDEKMRQDCTALLFLLIFKDCIAGSPSRGDVSLLVLLEEKVRVPFIAHVHGKMSEFTEESLYDSMVSDKWCLSSLQIQWNMEVYGGFENLINIDDASRNEAHKILANEILHLKKHDVQMLKSSSVYYCVESILRVIESGTSYTLVTDAVTELTLYVILYSISSYNFNASDQNRFLAYNWEKPFARFLRKLPSSKEDVVLLKYIIKFLVVLTPLFKMKDNYWLKSLLKDPSNALVDLLYTDSMKDDDIKSLSQELVNVITLCVVHEHNYLDYHSNQKSDTTPNRNWGHIVKILTDNLKLSDAEHFYYLAYLDAQLSCLVHLTAISGWSKSRAIATSKDTIPQLITSLCKLIAAFHCGKGHSATVSVMGLSITKNVLLVLSNLLTEKQQCKVRSWELCFFENTEDSNQLSTFFTLWFSRDVIIRAASLQLFSVLANSPEGAAKIIEAFKEEQTKIWDIVFEVILDCKEAAIVRENAVLLLNNLMTSTYSSGSCNSFKVFLKDLLRKHDFYNHLQLVLTSLFTLKVSNRLNAFVSFEVESNSNSDESAHFVNTVTPGLIKSICKFLHNAENICLNVVGLDLEEKGLAKLIFGTLCNPAMGIKNAKELVLYSDILEMNISVCQLLKKLSISNSSILGTILHTQDCLNVLFSLLDCKIYHSHLTQLVCLKNQLWTEIFNLVGVLSCCDKENDDFSICLEAETILSNTISVVGTNRFFEALFESLSCVERLDLQTSALTALVAILKPERFIKQNSDLKHDSFLSTCLDTLRSSKTVIMSSNDNKENIELKRNNEHKSNLLEEAYFGKVIESAKSNNTDVTITFVEDHNNSLMMGAELCKILLYLYDIANIETSSVISSKRALIMGALSCVLSLSQEAKKYAINKNLVTVITKELRDVHVKLSLESVDSLKRVQDKKRICPMLQDVDDMIVLLTNFMLNNNRVKELANRLSLADVVHKLWIWVSFQSVYVVDVLKLVTVYTTDYSEEAKKYAINKNLVTVITKELRDVHVKLSLESVDSLKRVQDKKRICPMLQDVDDMIVLLTNFMLNNNRVKELANRLSLSDVVHKLWIWVSFQSVYVVDVLKLVTVYTTDYSEEAKKYAINKNLVTVITKELRDVHVKLSLESVDSLKRVQDKKRICPMLQDVDDMIVLLTNFMLNNNRVKELANRLSLSDVVHKLWIWVSFQSVYVLEVLKLVTVYTTDYSEESVDSLKRVQDKKRICPMLQDVDDMIVLLTNFILNNNRVKELANRLILSDVVHKLWIWVSFQSVYVVDVLKLVTTDYSEEAKKYAINKNLVTVITKELRDVHVKLSLESVDSLKRVQDKKRICPMLQDVDDMIVLLTNFMLNNNRVKELANRLSLSDVVHKLWIWVSFQSVYVVDVLKLVTVYTTDYSEACQSLTLTSAVAGSGPKKSPSNTSMLHVVIGTVIKEIDQISRTHDLVTLQLAFQILTNCLDTFECRILILKSNLFQSACRLHPSISKRQAHWDHVEAVWLQFLHDFTAHPEGQSAVAKSNEVLESTCSMALNSKMSNREMAMAVLRNVAFYHPNRPRLLATDEFLSILQIKLAAGSKKEKQAAIATIWALAANNQKAKLVFKGAQFDVKLENMGKHWQLLKEPNHFLDREDVERINVVLDIIRR